MCARFSAFFYNHFQPTISLGDGTHNFIYSVCKIMFCSWREERFLFWRNKKGIDEIPHQCVRNM